MDYKKLMDDLGAECVLFHPDIFTEDIQGFFIPAHKIIFANIEADEIERQNIILHELGHLANHHVHYSCHPSGFQVMEEIQADRFMIEQRVREWLEGFDDFPDYINIYSFLDFFKLKYRLYDQAVQAFESQNVDR